MPKPSLDHTKLFFSHAKATARLHLLGALLERVGSHTDDNPLEATDLYELGRMIQEYADDAEHAFEAMCQSKLDELRRTDGLKEAA